LGVTSSAAHLGFLVTLGLSVVLLVAALVTAKLHKVKAHIGVVAAMVVALLATIYFAEAVGRHYYIDANMQRIHLPLAFLAAGTLLAPLTTGFLHWRGRVGVKAHKISVGIWGVLLLLALGTGALMLMASKPHESFAPGEGFVPPGESLTTPPRETPTPTPSPN